MREVEVTGHGVRARKSYLMRAKMRRHEWLLTVIKREAASYGLGNLK